MRGVAEGAQIDWSIRQWLMGQNLTRTTAGFFTWYGGVAALQKGIWGWWLTAAQCEPAESALAAQRTNPIPGMHQTQHKLPNKKGGYPAVLSIGAASTSNPVCTSGSHHLKRMLRCSNACEGGQQSNKVKAMEDMSCEEQLRTLDLSSLEKKSSRVVALYKFLRGGYVRGRCWALLPGIQW